MVHALVAMPRPKNQGDRPNRGPDRSLGALLRGRNDENKRPLGAEPAPVPAYAGKAGVPSATCRPDTDEKKDTKRTHLPAVLYKLRRRTITVCRHSPAWAALCQGQAGRATKPEGDEQG